ncbi:SPOR domain-containing protein [Litoreibacter sp.]|nr:SPOR domain-containing protein [Litoreibacter sp.]
MADTQYDAFGAQSTAYARQTPAAPQFSVLSKALSFLGAGSSVALVIGLGLWGYQLTVRDVTDVPVIRALEGPARVQPADPGGQLAQHQGLAVNNVQSEGQAEGPTPQVILAPEPIDLTTDDVILAAPAEAELPADDVAEAVGTVVSLSLEEQNLTVEQQAELLASRLAEGVEPLAPLEAEAQVTLARAEIPALDPSIPGVKRSRRPAQRPKVDLASLQQEAAIAAAVGSVLASAEVAPETVAAGTRLVQLGAYDERDLAIAEWDKIASKFEDYIDGKKRLIQEAKSGGRTFYRLRAVGFEDLNASRRFCAVLVAANAACIPVLAR